MEMENKIKIEMKIVVKYNELRHHIILHNIL